MTTVTIERSAWASPVHCPGERGRAGRDRDPVARHADLETASIPTELDFGRYRHPREVTDPMSIANVDTRARAAAVRLTIVLQNTQARAELPARSRWTIAASRIEAHRAREPVRKALRPLSGKSQEVGLGRMVRFMPGTGESVRK